MRSVTAIAIACCFALSAPAEDPAATSMNPFHFGKALEFLRMPADLLWTPPVASQREPHFRLRFTDNDDFKADTAIGAVFPIFLLHPGTRVA